MAEPRTKSKILVFARAPEPGAVKTRLIPLIGKYRAAALQRLMIERAVAHAHAAAIGPVELWCTPDPAHSCFIDCATRFGISRRQQCEGALGERMFDAVKRTLDDDSRAIVIGTDCPALSVDEMRRAASALEDHDVVMIPAEDGGYALIGLKQCDGRVFAGVEWGTSSVLERTRTNLQELGWRWRELPATWDVDRPADFERLVSSGLIPDLQETLRSLPA